MFLVHLDNHSNAATATALAARTIVVSDGTSNINLPGVNSAGNQLVTQRHQQNLQTARTIGGVSL